MDKVVRVIWNSNFMFLLNMFPHRYVLKVQKLFVYSVIQLSKKVAKNIRNIKNQ